jgi:multidrug resistance efflux pump
VRSQLVSRCAATQAQLDAATRDQQVASRTLASAQRGRRSSRADGRRRRQAYQAASEIRRGRRQVGDAERNLRQTEVATPFAGVVTNVNAIDVGAPAVLGNGIYVTRWPEHRSGRRQDLDGHRLALDRAIPASDVLFTLDV